MDGSRKSGRGGQTIAIDPVSRIEGHLKVEVVVDGGRVQEARCSGTLFRGFENILVGRYPVDAVRLTQRVCGVCPVVHGSASAMGLDEALGVAAQVPENGRLVRNLILASNFLQSHILHFFTLTALDFVDVTAAADYAGGESDLAALREFLVRRTLEPFVPRYEGDYRCDKKTNVNLVRGYLKALQVRRTCHEMITIFGGKMPHEIGIVPGGVTGQVTADKIASFMGKLQEVRAFVDDVYIPAVFTVAGAYGDYFDIGAGCGRFLSYGGFNLDNASTDLLSRHRLLPAGYLDAAGNLTRVAPEKIGEEVACSRYAAECAAPPAEGKTIPQPAKPGAYSWLKAPRYDGAPAEVGPLARTLVAYAGGQPAVKREVDAALAAAKVPASKLPSVLGRHLARALEARILAAAMQDWLKDLRPGEPAAVALTIPEEGRGAGLLEGPRGALGHWVSIRGRVIDRYQLVVPTTWNGSPRDAAGTPGPIEQALLGAKVKDPANPFEIVRIVRSFDPCLACAVHAVTVRGVGSRNCRIV